MVSALARDRRGGTPKGQRQVSGEKLARYPADAVGAEQRADGA